MLKKATILILEGDGIAREVCAEAEETLKCIEDRFSIPLEILKYPCGGAYWLETGKQWPEEAQMACANDVDAILFGGVGWPGAVLPWGAPAGLDVIFWLRKQLDLFVNVRRVKPLPGVGQKIDNGFKEIYDPDSVDLILVRENTEGLYTSPRGVDLTRGMITELSTDVSICTRKGIERLARFSLSLTQKEGDCKPDGHSQLYCSHAGMVGRPIQRIIVLGSREQSSQSCSEYDPAKSHLAC